MKKFLSFFLSIVLGLTPLFSSLAAASTQTPEGGGETLETGEMEELSNVGFLESSSKTKILAAKTKKECKSGYFRNPKTGRCKKLVTVSESKSTITTTTYNPNTGKATVKKVCKNGYWWNKKSERCNKKKTCKIGYLWQSKDNTCKKIVCKIGFKVQDKSNVCKRLVCEKGHVINQKTGNCVINRNGKYKECEAGWTLDLTTLECAKIGTKGSKDPASIAAKKSASLAVHYETKSLKALANTQTGETETTEEETPKKDCGEGKFLNPKTNRCKNLQTVTETSTGKTITTYNPETGEGTTIKICNEGYELNEETNRCNKIKEEKSTVKNDSSKSSSNNTSKTTTKTCPEGKFLNPKTNRCKNLQTISESTTGKTITTYDPKTGEATTEKICNDGYELDTDSNRCKKKKENKGEDYALKVPDLGGKPNFIAIGSIIAIVVIGIGFIIFEFRHEITKFFKGLKLHRKP